MKLFNPIQKTRRNKWFNLLLGEILVVLFIQQKTRLLASSLGRAQVLIPSAPPAFAVPQIVEIPTCQALITYHKICKMSTIKKKEWTQGELNPWNQTWQVGSATCWAHS